MRHIATGAVGKRSAKRLPLAVPFPRALFSRALSQGTDGTVSSPSSALARGHRWARRFLWGSHLSGLRERSSALIAGAKENPCVHLN